jgi:hypothetical protein
LSEQFTIKDSGRRQSFASGMVRDTTEGKVDFTTVLNGPMFDRWAAHLTKGEIKYPDAELGKPNWMRASGQEEYLRARKSAFRHFRQWMRGDTDEDHASAVFFNINLAEYVKAELQKSAGSEIKGVDVTPLAGYRFGATIVDTGDMRLGGAQRWDVRVGRHYLWSIIPVSGGSWGVRSTDTDAWGMFPSFKAAKAALDKAEPPPT